MQTLKTFSERALKGCLASADRWPSQTRRRVPRPNKQRNMPYLLSLLERILYTGKQGHGRYMRRKHVPKRHVCAHAKVLKRRRVFYSDARTNVWGEERGVPRIRDG